MDAGSKEAGFLTRAESFLFGRIVLFGVFSQTQHVPE